MNKWWQINIHQLCESNQLMLPERWDFWTLWIAQRRWKPLCLGCWNGRFGCFFGLDGVAFRVFATPFVASIIFFLFKENEKWNIYIYILSDVFFGNCWCCLCLLMFHPIYKWVMFCFYACNYMVRDRNRLSLRMVQNEGDMEWHWRHYSGIIRMKHVSRFSIFRLREQCDENKCWDWTSNHLLAFSSTLLNLK